MGINILLREGMRMFSYTTMGMGWVYYYGNGLGMGIRSWEWDRKSYSCSSLVWI